MTGDDRPVPAGLLGNLPAYARDPLGSLRRWSVARPAARLRFGPMRTLLFNRPAGIGAVLERQASDFRKPANVRRLATPVIGGSLFTSVGEEWERQRAMLSGPLDPSAIAEHEVTIGELAAGWSTARRAGEEIDLGAEMMDLCTRIAGRVLFGSDLSDDEVRRIGAALEVTSADFQERLDSPLRFALPRWLPLAGNRRFAAAVEELDRVAYRLIREAKARAAGGQPGGARETTLDRLVHAQAHHPWLTDRLIRDNLVMLLTQAREDPALAASWTLYLLARHPDAERRLRAELVDAAGDRPAMAGDLARLPYMAAVIAESLRLYPIAYGLGREAARDTVVDGVEVRRGTLALVSQWSSHRDPEHFEDPDAFRPERWRSGDGRDRPGYFPFGLGPRRCLGEPLARVEIPLLVASLVRSWRLRLADGEEVKPLVRLSLRPSRPIRIVLDEAVAQPS